MKIFNRHSSEKKSSQDLLPFRLNLLFFIVFILFAVLVAQLAYLQIVFGNKFQAEIDRTDKSIVTASVPRGMMYDSKGRIVVGNKAKNAISYTKGPNVDNEQVYGIANKLSKYVTLKRTDTKVSKRDTIDYYLANKKNSNKVYKKLPRSAKYNGKEQKSDDEVYANEVKYVKSQHPKFNEDTKQKAAIYKKMSSSYELSTIYVKNDGVTSSEMAKVSEHLTELPGIRIATDWDREYPNGSSMKGIIGSVSTEQQGLPDNQSNQLLAQGYSRNDRVGTSYLEKSYESVLSGSKTKIQINTNHQKKITGSKVVYAGSMGGNLNLTMDSKYQTMVEKALKSTYQSAKTNGATSYSDGAYAVAVNPNTGAVLAMAGINRNTENGKTEDDPLGVINRTFVMGSAVKGATVLGGFMDGVITPEHNTLPDEPIYLPGTPVKKSVYPIGTYSSLDAKKALEVSSNEYMMQVAMREGHAKYVPNKYISMNNDIFTKMRGYYNQFGLGIKTGIDIDGEASGMEGPTKSDNGSLKVGSALDLSYGNYDAYTLIQMAQYISTIANGGYRMRPYVVQSIQKSNKNGSKGGLLSTTQPEVLNRVGFTQSELDIVKQGMYNAVHGHDYWTTATSLSDINPSVSGKTGTAQSFFYNPKKPNDANPPQTITTSFVGYAPSNNPQIAIAIVFPNLTTEDGNYNLSLAHQMFADYYKLNNIK